MAVSGPLARSTVMTSGGSPLMQPIGVLRTRSRLLLPRTPSLPLIKAALLSENSLPVEGPT